jgi:hypothetical protein
VDCLSHRHAKAPEPPYPVPAAPNAGPSDIPEDEDGDAWHATSRGAVKITPSSRINLGLTLSKTAAETMKTTMKMLTEGLDGWVDGNKICSGYWSICFY